ncbi:hypothetical protein [uncultured Parabacteroides sp.]|uniref:hypothetical protein n=1 Tax=uncultured Parabacteroides sp. TaxID=512312 RepID=UPI0025F3FFA3|nr:hypothetical protein [uncultured Parabacteroides sp.]
MEATEEEKKNDELQEQKICPNCKTVYYKKASRYCSRCGSKLTTYEKKVTLESKKKRKISKAALVWLYLSILVVIFLLIMTNIVGPTDHQTNESDTTIEQQPDSIQLSIMEDANISFEDLKKLEKEFELKVVEIRTGFARFEDFWYSSPLLAIVFTNDKNEDVIWGDQGYTKWRVIIDNEISPSLPFHNKPNFKDPISFGQQVSIDNTIFLSVKIESNMVKNQDIFIELLTEDGEKLCSIPVKKEFKSSKEISRFR